VLQTTTNSSEIERDVREKIDSAKRDLGRVTYTTLSKDGRSRSTTPTFHSDRGGLHPHA
jgi:hypothetical protein